MAISSICGGIMAGLLSLPFMAACKFMEIHVSWAIAMTGAFIACLYVIILNETE